MATDEPVPTEKRTTPAPDVEALKLLYTESGARADRISDREFSVTTAVITLHVFALAGVIATPSIAFHLRLLAIAAFILFDVLSVHYICQKAKAYAAADAVRRKAERALKNRAYPGKNNVSESSNHRKGTGLTYGYGGSAYFVVVILLVLVATGLVLWLAKDNERSSDGKTGTANKATE